MAISCTKISFLIVSTFEDRIPLKILMLPLLILLD
jgi:hypothetical protein